MRAMPFRVPRRPGTLWRVPSGCLRVWLGRPFVGRSSTALLAILLSVWPAGVREADASTGRDLSPVSMRVTVGFDGYLRGNPTWAPIRVELRNRGESAVDGMVAVEDAPLWYPAQMPQGMRASYEASAFLPPGADKEVTLRLPSTDIRGVVQVTFRTGDRVLAQNASYPARWPDDVISIGALTDSPAAVAWLHQFAGGRFRLPGLRRSAGVALIHLTPSKLDPVPEVLAAFDILVLADVDASQLDGDQWTGLEQYVRNGGALLLVGGPGWQGTLQRVPPALLPGVLAGSRVVGNLSGLGQTSLFQTGAPPAKPTTISLLSHPRGAVLASQNGVPLAVRMGLGNGQVEYLAFDPSDDPITSWPGAQRLAAKVAVSAATAALRRMSIPSTYWSPWFLDPSNWSSWFLDYDEQPLDVLTELSNTRPASIPPLIPVSALLLLFLLLRPAVRVLLRRPGRPDLSWIAVSALSLLLLVPPAGLAFHLRGRISLVNSIGVVELDNSHQESDPNAPRGNPLGGTGRYPATFYTGLFAPVPGDYHLQYDAPALPASDMPPSLLPASRLPGASVSQAGLSKVSWRFVEGAQTGIDFLSMGFWSSRALVMRTSVELGGTLEDNVHLDAAGDIVGTVHNATGLTLHYPAILAGSAFQRLPDMPPNATLSVRLRPSITFTEAEGQPLERVYGRASFRRRAIGCDGGQVPYPADVGGSGYTVSQPSGQLSCADPGSPAESSLRDRVRNAVSMLPESGVLSSMGQPLLVGWTDAALTSFSVDGASPSRRDLALLVKPLTLQVPPETLRLQPGTLAARLVDILPVRQDRWCCFPTVQPVSLGAGGAATFEFDFPRSGHRLRQAGLRLRQAGLWSFRSLDLTVNPDGVNGMAVGIQDIPTGVGFAYDWHADRWVPLRFAGDTARLDRPNRFVSATGVLLVRLRATADTGEITILDPHLDLQLAGIGAAGART